MRFLFDAYWWVEGPGANRTVLREIVTAWTARFPEDEPFATVPRAHLTKAQADAPAGLTFLPVRAPLHALANLFELPRIIRRIAPDATIAQNFTPLHGGAHTFIHDLMFLDNPEWFSRSERLYFWPMAPSSRRARGVLTSTRTEARRVAQRTSQRNISAVGLAVAADILDAEATAPSADLVGTDFAVSVGRLNVRKNLQNAILGAGYSTRITPESPLLVVGESDPRSKSAVLSAEVVDLIDSGAVRFLGHVSQGELKWLYENAHLAVYISLDEGFGLPPIEAAHFGTPVLVSDIAVFHETMGTAAEFVPPHDVAAIAAGIDRAWGRAEASGTATSNGYSWTGTAERIRAAVTA